MKMFDRTYRPHRGTATPQHARAEADDDTGVQHHGAQPAGPNALMPNQQLAEFIARALPSLTHPGTDTTGPTPIPLPMFNTTNIAPEQAQQWAADANLPTPDVALLTGEALVHAMEQDGKTVIDTAELEQLRAAAAAAPQLDRYRELKVYCRRCNNLAFKFGVDYTNPSTPTIDGPTALAQLEHVMSACPHGLKR